MEMLSFDCVHDALQAMTEQLAAAVRQKTDGPFHIALSGGGTAKLLFRLWAQEYVRKIAWSRLRFYWVDERCVPPDDPESNFKYADELLFQKIGIPDNHLFRIRGEEDPEQEARRYAAAVRAELPLQDGLPRFDAVVLGIGDDGHTASIFPHTPGLLTDPLRGIAASGHRSVADHDDRPADPQRGGTAVSGHRPRKGGDPAKNRRPAGSGISRGVHPPPRRTGGGLYEL